MIPSRLFILLIYLLGFQAIVFSQSKMVDRSNDSRPSWSTKTPKGVQNDYYVGFGESRISLAEAKRLAIGNAVQSIVEERSLSAESSLMTRRSYDFNRVIDEVSIKGKSSTIEGLRQKEFYYETWNEENSSNRYIFWVLASVPKNDPGHLPNKYTPLFKSVVVPGWGQFHIGKQRKGYVFLFGEIALLSTAVITNFQSGRYSDDARNANSVKLREFYNDRSNLMYNLSVYAGIMAGGLYAYNVFDALFHKGDEGYVSIPDTERLAIVQLNRSTIALALQIPF